MLVPRSLGRSHQGGMDAWLRWDALWRAVVRTCTTPPHSPPSHRVADWFAQLNNKMGGDLKKIQTVGNYMVEIWKAVGMDMDRVEFLHASGQQCIGNLICFFSLDVWGDQA